MKLSIIVPVYDMLAGGKLAFCMDSLLTQTLDPSCYEIVAVDDHSTDGSFALLKEYEKAYPGRVVALHNKKNRRQGGAKNKGLAYARGEWIGFVDADDWVAPDFYERLITAAEKEGADMAGCDYCLTGEQSFAPGERIANNSMEQSGLLDSEKKRSLYLRPGSLVVKVYRRELLLGDYVADSQPRVKLFPEWIFYEDNAVAGALMLRAKRFAYIPEALYFYYQHEESTVHSVSIGRLEDRKQAGRQLRLLAMKDGSDKEFPEEVEYRFTELFYKNTLFSAMQAKPAPKGCYMFCYYLGRDMKQAFPDFQKNRYYQQFTNEEEKRLIAYQQRFHLFFYLYYRLLWVYRRFRKK